MPMRVKVLDKKVSLRTCCICRTKKPKYELQRFVWQDGKIQEDPGQTLPGRGAYCCTDVHCAELLTSKTKKWKRLFRL
ncbi:YlxR family protein [Desulforhopalus sp. IMCC35007]|uniref:YlxR family protein n=1 Tax=Desulforhopalus sp. IMCC35007 TaxID=2569543 RepID=UPI0010AEBE8E|nr:DUF448 domain-containing protein [Desulforhopalus sp. IMCC35007]